MNDKIKNKKFLSQDDLYDFPYHYIPEKISQSIIKPFRVRYWLLGYQYLVEYIKEKLSKIENKKILDFGCGDGRLIYELKSNNKNIYYGYEISNKAAMFFKAFNREVPLIENFEDLNNKENYFDYIIMSEVIEHIPDLEINSNINLIHKILKHEGILIVSAPHENLPVHKKHYRHYNSNSLLANFTGEKFQLVEKKFLFKNNFFLTLLRKIFFNRLFIINSNFLHSLYYKINMKFFFGNENNCESILLILKKK